MAKSSRAITVSGRDKYVPLVGLEIQAYEVRFYWTALTELTAPYSNLEYYPKKKFYGRIAFSQEEYVVEEKLLYFNNQLAGRFYSDSYKLLWELQCMHQESQHLYLDGFISQRFITDTQLPQPPAEEAITSALYLAARQNAQNLLDGKAGTFTNQISQPDHKAYSPRSTPRMPINGLYYSMGPGASGQLVIVAYSFDEVCSIPNGGPALTQDNQGLSPATAGGPDVVGTPSLVPPSTGDGAPPVPGENRPSSPSDPNPLLPPNKPGGGGPGSTTACIRYVVEYKYTNRGVPVTSRQTVPGRIGPARILNESFPSGSFQRWVADYGIDCPGQGGTVQLGQNWLASEPPAVTGVSVTVIRVALPGD